MQRMDNMNNVVAVAAVASFEWLTWLREFDGFVLQFLGIVFLAVQIYYKIKNRGK